jgi:hypothetical protein
LKINLFRKNLNTQVVPNLGIEVFGRLSELLRLFLAVFSAKTYQKQAVFLSFICNIKNISLLIKHIGIFLRKIVPNLGTTCEINIFRLPTFAAKFYQYGSNYN